MRRRRKIMLALVAVLAAVPPDPVDGQPLRYRLQTDGAFLLYL